ncbi:DNA polymerase sliding clamp subunit A [Staphylothermus marinus F1]|uniref:DNA polymerase sliding clamp n=1 Tax=Staphylothermus marinus (strain ATCC 43588 / DSM 3639 / JCM 9404 / F1) TaxID=399550 RepID=A3DP96_STAMF|nr:DNA polymerase sliding clamp [Staphylothermus marinus]ABN70456.1 DNA polymerase sliding clamp subunit A [Staphylothermus marinus F1]
MARIVYPEAKYIREMITALGKLVDEVAFKITPEALIVKAIDPARVALIDIYLPQTAFLEYDVSEEVVAGLSSANLSKLLKKVKKGDKFVMDVTEEQITITIESTIRRIYRFRNLEVPVPEIPEAKLEFNVEAQLLVDVIKHAIKDAETVGDLLEMEAPDQETLYLRGRGVSMTETKLVAGMPALLNLEVKEPSKSVYQLEYLKHIVNLTKIAELAIIRFSSDMPLELEFSLSEGRVKYLLAPAAV